MTPLPDADAARRLRWRIERIRDPEHPLYKPRLRGWTHAVMAPLTLAAGIVLIVLAPTATLRWASAVYAVTGLLLFGVSATYHLVQWNEVVSRVLKRLDHTNIMLVIAGTYTPLSLALLVAWSAGKPRNLELEALDPQPGRVALIDTAQPQHGRVTSNARWECTGRGGRCRTTLKLDGFPKIVSLRAVQD